MRFKVAVEGAEEVQQFLRTMTPETKKRLRPRLIKWGEKVLAVSRPGVPVSEDEDPGSLRDIGRVLRPTLSSTKAKLVVSVVYGGDPLRPFVRRGGRKDDTGYAIIQHEDLTLKHDDGRAKYLELPFLAAAPEIPELVLEVADEMQAEAAAATANARKVMLEAGV